MNDAKKKAYELAAEASKQQVTLASAFLALSATLLRDVFENISPPATGLIAGAWIALFVSIAFGTRALFQLAAVLGRAKSDADRAVPRPSRVRGLNRSARAQNGFFLAALALLLLFGLSNLRWG